MTGVIRSRRSGHIAIRQTGFSGMVLRLTMAALAGLALAGVFFLKTADDVKPLEAIGSLFADLGKLLFQPQVVHFEAGEIPMQILVTLAMAFLTTLIGAVSAFFLALIAARNIGNARLSGIISGFVAFVRAIPTVLWVLIFAIGAGLGSVAAIVGMSFHSMGYLLKAYKESFEEIDSGVVEALKAGGASWVQIVAQAVIPASISLLVSWTFIRFEINFVTSVAMGAAVGAGGIGFSLAMAANHYFHIREVGAFTLMILAVAVVLELAATRIKESQRIHV